MRKRKNPILVISLAFLLLFMLAGCEGIIKPTIGEGFDNSDPSATASPSGEGETGFDPDNPMGGAENGPGGLEAFSAGESKPAPAMTGTVVAQFYESHEASSSLGAINIMTSIVNLYNADNADGNNALISVTMGDSSSYTAGKWELTEDGQYNIVIDEFTTYSTTELDGVLTLTGVRYNFGMDGKGEVNIPQRTDFDPVEAAAIDAAAVAPTEGGAPEGNTPEEGNEAGSGDGAPGGMSEGDGAPEGIQEGTPEDMPEGMPENEGGQE